MTEQLVEFSTAKLAKEKGFDEPCIDTFNGKGQEQDRYNLIAEDVLDNDVYLDPDDIRTWFENTNSELEKVGLNWNEYFERNGIDHKAFISRPTQSLLQRWIRTYRGVHIEIHRNASGWYWSMCKSDGGTNLGWSDISGPNDGGVWGEFEDALENALQVQLSYDLPDNTKVIKHWGNYVDFALKLIP